MEFHAQQITQRYTYMHVSYTQKNITFVCRIADQSQLNRELCVLYWVDVRNDHKANKENMLWGFSLLMDSIHD